MEEKLKKVEVPVDEQTGEVAETVAPTKVKDIGQRAVINMLNQVCAFAEIENTKMSEKDKKFAVGIIENIAKTLAVQKLTWEDLDITGCSLPSQIKRFARLGLSCEEKELYIDVRKNQNKGDKKDIAIKKQYQGIQKEMINFSCRKIERFRTDIVCSKDEFMTEVDFATGLEKIVKHKKYEADNYDRNKLDNIVKAYSIAYIRENNDLNGYTEIVDKNRIMRAYNSSASYEKTIWKADTVKMVKKTAVWELYANQIRMFMHIPEDILDDWSKTQDVLDFTSKETKYDSVEKANDFVKENVGKIETEVVSFK